MADADTDPLIRRSRSILPIEVNAITAILALALALLAGAGAALYQRSRPANYISIAVLLIDQPTAVATTPDSGPLLKLQQLRYQYADLVRTDIIADPVARQLNLSVSRVEGEVSALVDPTSFTITIVGTAKSPSESNSVAQATTGQLISYVAKSQKHLGLIPTNQVVLDEVTTPHAGVKLNASTRKVLLSAAIGFVVVGAAFLIVADLLRRRW
jgi:capsular polysaccharide biosynthesis protein